MWQYHYVRVKKQTLRAVAPVGSLQFVEDDSDIGIISRQHTVTHFANPGR